MFHSSYYLTLSYPNFNGIMAAPDVLLRLIHEACDNGDKTYDEIFTNLDRVKDPPKYGLYSNETYPSAEVRATKKPTANVITLRAYVHDHVPRDGLFVVKFGPFKSKIKVYDWASFKKGFAKAKEIASHIHKYCADEAEDKLRELHAFVNERLLVHLQKPYEFVMAPQIEDSAGSEFDELCTKANEIATATGKRVHMRFETEGVHTKIVGPGFFITGDSWRELQSIEKYVKRDVGDSVLFREEGCKLLVGTLSRPKNSARIQFPELSGARVYIHTFSTGTHKNVVITFTCYLNPFIIEWGNGEKTESFRFVVVVTPNWNAVSCL